jgi:hypothetical protein
MQDELMERDPAEELKVALAELLLLQLIEAGDALQADVRPIETLTLGSAPRLSRLVQLELVSA